MWVELELEVPLTEADDTASNLIEAGAAGVETLCASLTAPPLAEPSVPRQVPSDPNRALLVASYPVGVSLAAALDQAQGVVPSVLRARVRTDTDWQERYKAYFKPLRIGRSLLVVPVWETVPEVGLRTIRIDPGMAFGTGQHATTALCLELMEEALAGRPVHALLDVGCGSGILAIGAQRLGVEMVCGVDIDPDAIDSARQNLIHNGIVSGVTLDTTPIGEIHGPYPFVVANILASTLIEFRAELQRCCVPGGLLLLSGILVSQEDEVTRAYNDGFALCGRRQRDEWTALLLQRTNEA